MKLSTHEFAEIELKVEKLRKLKEFHSNSMLQDFAKVTDTLREALLENEALRKMHGFSFATGEAGLLKISVVANGIETLTVTDKEICNELLGRIRGYINFQNMTPERRAAYDQESAREDREGK